MNPNLLGCHEKRQPALDPPISEAIMQAIVSSPHAVCPNSLGAYDRAIMGRDFFCGFDRDIRIEPNFEPSSSIHCRFFPSSVLPSFDHTVFFESIQSLFESLSHSMRAWVPIWIHSRTSQESTHTEGT